MKTDYPNGYVLYMHFNTDGANPLYASDKRMLLEIFEGEYPLGDPKLTAVKLDRGNLFLSPSESGTATLTGYDQYDNVFPLGENALTVKALSACGEERESLNTVEVGTPFTIGKVATNIQYVNGTYQIQMTPGEDAGAATRLSLCGSIHRCAVSAWHAWSWSPRSIRTSYTPCASCPRTAQRSCSRHST